MGKISRALISLWIMLVAIVGHAGSASLHSVPIQWKNDRGNTTRLSDLKGKWVVISMMYTSCPSSCPMIVQKMRRIETLLKNKSNLDTQFVLVTFDPERDTPGKLANYRKKTAITETNWHFLSGTPTDARKFSMLLGIKFAKDAESGEFLHDNKIVLLTPSGEIATKLQTLGEPENEILETIQKHELSHESR